MVSKTIWPYTEVSHNQIGRQELTILFNDYVFATPKPEKLLEKVIYL